MIIANGYANRTTGHANNTDCLYCNPKDSRCLRHFHYVECKEMCPDFVRLYETGIYNNTYSGGCCSAVC